LKKWVLKEINPLEKNHEHMKKVMVTLWGVIQTFLWETVAKYNWHVLIIKESNGIVKSKPKIDQYNHRNVEDQCII